MNDERQPDAGGQKQRIDQVWQGPGQPVLKQGGAGFHPHPADDETTQAEHRQPHVQGFEIEIVQCCLSVRPGALS